MNATIEAQPVAGELRRDEAMSKHTSWRVGGPADYFFKPASVDGLVAFLQDLGEDVPVFWFGLGSNQLLGPRPAPQFSSETVAGPGAGPNFAEVVLRLDRTGQRCGPRVPLVTVGFRRPDECPHVDVRRQSVGQRQEVNLKSMARRCL